VGGVDAAVVGNAGRVATRARVVACREIGAAAGAVDDGISRKCSIYNCDDLRGRCTVSAAVGGCPYSVDDLHELGGSVARVLCVKDNEVHVRQSCGSVAALVADGNSS